MPGPRWLPRAHAGTPGSPDLAATWSRGRGRGRGRRLHGGPWRRLARGRGRAATLLEEVVRGLTGGPGSAGAGLADYARPPCGHHGRRPTENRGREGGEGEDSPENRRVQGRLLLLDLDLEREARSYATVGWVYRRERRRWLPISSSIASRPSERGGCEYDEGRHEQHNVCEKRRSNDPAKRTWDLEQARREKNIYIYLYYRVFSPELYSFRKY
jgi:hypothetical protein